MNKFDKKILISLLILATYAGWKIYDIARTSKLFEAIENNDATEVKRLIAKGADINAIYGPISPKTPLTMAIDAGDIEIVKILLNAGANTNPESNNPLAEALAIAGGYYSITPPGRLRNKEEEVRQNQRTIIKLLVEAQAANKDFVLDIIPAIIINDVDTVKKLTQSTKFSLQQEDSLWLRERLMTAALFSGNTHMIDYIWNNVLEKKIAVDGYTLLQLAIKNNDQQVIDYVLSLPETDINQRGESQQTALHTAVIHPIKWKQSGNKETVKKLLEKKANPNAQDAIGNTPLHDAMNFGRSEEIVQLLLQYGADRNIKNKEGKTPDDIYKEEQEKWERM